MSIAFKEWAIVCEALGSGVQSIILRKGGIAEGKAGFQFKHEDFFLFPTLFHEQLQKTTLPPGTNLPSESGVIRIEFMAHVEWTMILSDLSLAGKLSPFHVWKPEVVQERFRYDEAPGLSLAFVRIFRLHTEWSFPDAPRFGGCRSWVEIPEPPPLALSAVLDEDAHMARGRELAALLSRA